MGKTIVSISMVKNEADIIESFVRHTLTFVDRMLIMDHMSTDRTLEILQNLQEEGLPLVVQHSYQVEHAQSEMMTGLLRQAVDAYGADLVLPLDADEFLVNTENRQSCRDILEEWDTELAYLLPWRIYELSEPQKEQETFLLMRPCYREQSNVQDLQKIVIGRGLAMRGSLLLEQGNHNVCWSDLQGKKALPIERKPAPFLHLAHFPMRTEEQIKSKYMVGWLSNVARYSIHTTMGCHWGEAYHQLAMGEKLDILWGKVKQPEPVDLRPYVAALPLRYTKAMRQGDVWRNVLLASEAMAQAYTEGKILQRKRLVTIVIWGNGDEKALRASLDEAWRQTYPYKEVFVLYGKLPLPPGEAAVALDDDEKGDVFFQLSQKARGDYVQWLFPGDRIRPDKIMKMLAFLELEYGGDFALANRQSRCAAWMPYMHVKVTKRIEPILYTGMQAWEYLRKHGKYFSGGIASLLLHRRVMEACQWFRGCFWEKHPLPFLMFRALLQGSLGAERRVRFMVIQADYCPCPPETMDMGDWLLHQIAWGCVLQEERSAMEPGAYEEAVRNFQRYYVLVQDKREEKDAALWAEYKALRRALSL